MSTLWANGDGLKIDRGATKQRTVLFNLTQEFYPAQPSSPIKNLLSQHFLTILLHSRGTNVHFMCKWRQGIKIELRATEQRQYSLTSHKNFTQPNHPLQEKIRYVSIFHNFASFQVNKCPLYGQMETGT